MIQSGKVSASAMPMNAQAARNLPSTACHSGTGRVSSSSIVPLLRSSAHSRIVIAGTRNRYSHGMEAEERLQVGLAALEEVAEVERERAGQHQEDDDEHIGDRRGEIAGAARAAATMKAGDHAACSRGVPG